MYSTAPADGAKESIRISDYDIVEGDLKAPFSIATTPRCRGRCYSFPWIAPLYL